MDFYFTDRKFNLIEIASTDGQAPYQLSTAPDFQSVKAAARTLSGTLIFTREQANRINQMAALGNYVLYHDKFGKDRFMTIMDIRHDPLNGTHDFTAEDAGVDLINETVGAYTADKAYNIAYYINKFTYDSGFEIGTNEISTLSRKLKWDSTDETSLARILSVATQFDAELDFSFEISGTNVVKRYINIYKHRGADNQVRLYLDKDINNIVTTGDIYDLYTSVYATGGTPEGSDKPITLKGYKWTDPDGRYELGADGILRDTVAVQLWSRILSNDNPNPTKHHLQRSKSYEASTQASLLQSALGGLKKAVNPAVNYEVDIAVLPENIEIGDTVHIVDDNEDLYLSARVLELKYDYALEQYTATLGNYLIEVSTVDEKLKELADDVKNMPKVVQYYPWVRYADDADGNGFSMFPQDKAYMAVVFGKTSIPSENVADYAGKWQKTLGNDGQDGANGIEGPKGDDGQTMYFHKAYANSSDGKTDFSITDPANKAYLGTCSDFTKADPTDPAKYLWQLVKGDKGDKGDPGKDGVAGKDGLGIKSTAIAYQLSSSGTTVPSGTWSTTVPVLIKGQYLWTRTTLTYTDNSSEPVYSVSYVAKDGNSGKDGVAGKDGVGIKSTAITYQVSTSGTAIPTGTWVAAPPTVPAGQFLWTKTVWTYTDGSTETGYSVAKSGNDGAQGPKGDTGAQGPKGDKGDTGVGVPGEPGKDGKTSYVHTAWAWSPDGSDRFMTSYPAVNYLLNSAVGPDMLANNRWNDSYALLSDGIRGLTGEFEVGFDVTLSEDVTDEQSIEITLQTKGGGLSIFTIFPFRRISLTPGVTTHLTRVFTGDYTAFTGNGGRIAAKFGNAATVTMHLDNMYIKRSQESNTWTPAPSDDYQAAYPAYRGEYTDFTQADSENPSDYTWVRVLGQSGEDGIPGKPGADGKTSYTHVAYANSSDSERNMNNWVLSEPAKQAANITYKDGVNTLDYKGVGYYEVFNFPVKAKKGQSFTFSFSWTQPDVKSLDGSANGASVSIADAPLTGSQIGRNVIYLGVSKTNSKLFTISGTATADETYVSINLGFLLDGIQWQFKASFQQDFSQDPGNHEYMGWYSDFTEIDSNDPSQYGWSLIKGADGANGTPGKAGADGKTPYFHQAWADSSDGKTNFSTTVSLGKKYLGTYTDFTVADSTDPTRYKWIELAGAVEQHVDDAINNLIPPPSSGISYPANPKKGQQHWLTDANSKPKGLFQYDGTEWVAVPVNADTISANTLNGMTINGVTINGSTINSPNINVPFNNVPANPDEPEGSPYAQLVSGTTQLTSNLKISANLTDGTNKTAQWLRTLVSPQGLSNIISTPDASKALSQIDISLGTMFLSEWHSDVTANDGFVSSYLKAGDTTTYEYVDVLAANDNINSGTVRYTRKGSQVNVGFRFSLKNDTGWVALGKIRTGYTPASLPSVGINCPSVSHRGYSCVVYPNNYGWRLIPTSGQGVGDFQGSVSYTTYDYYPYNDAK